MHRENGGLPAAVSIDADETLTIPMGCAWDVVVPHISGGKSPEIFPA
jgi:hypothetical protein